MSGGQNVKSVRIWRTLNVDEVKEQTMFIEDLYGFCGNCRAVGLNYLTDAACKECGTQFKYLASKLKDPAEIGKILNRIKKEGLSYQLIDRDDFERASAHDAVNKLFG